MEKITMSEYDLAEASGRGFWSPFCPYCDPATPAEPDTEIVYCINCDQLIEIESPLVQRAKGSGGTP